MFFELLILTIVICVGVTSLVIVIGLTSAGLLVCADKWGMLRAWEGQQAGWLIKRCDFCAGYWLSVLLVVMSGASLCSLLGAVVALVLGRGGGASGAASGSYMPGGSGAVVEGREASQSSKTSRLQGVLLDCKAEYFSISRPNLQQHST
jgi:hypothetical protein